MNEFSVKPELLAGYGDEISRLMSSMSSIRSQISSVQRNLDWNVKQRAQINSTLNVLKNNMDSLSKKTDQYGKGLVSCAKWYANTENSILTNAGGEAAFNTSEYGSGSSSSAQEDKWDWISKQLLNLLKIPFKGSVISSLVSLVVDGALPNWASGKSVSKWISNIAGLTGGVAKLVEKVKWNDMKSIGKGLLGLNEKVDLTKYTGAWDKTWKNFVKGFKFDSESSFFKNAGVAAKWLGTAATAVGNVFMYHEDAKYNDYNSTQKWTSAALKTAGDIALTLGVTAAVTAAGAPAVAVGAISAGVIWVADTVTKSITTAVCGEEYGLVEGATKVIVSGGTAVCKWISSWWE